MKYPNHYWLRNKPNAIYIGELDGADFYEWEGNYFKATGASHGRWILYRDDAFRRESCFSQAHLDFCLAHKNMTT